jgi:hypothetical protein
MYNTFSPLPASSKNWSDASEIGVLTWVDFLRPPHLRASPPAQELYHKQLAECRAALAGGMRNTSRSAETSGSLASVRGFRGEAVFWISRRTGFIRARRKPTVVGLHDGSMP